ncbi:MAG TPA: shikimate kinase [Terriglobales bacterium]|nr:shikimate kinase [Terriglobales bacterium]
MYGLIGKPLGHSFSPLLHKMLWGCDYELFPMEEGEVRAFFAARAFDGVNVTIPYKELALTLCDEVDDRAARIGAVNTVVKKGNRLMGYNTDFDGLSYLASRAGISFAGRKAVIFGSGGTAKTATAVAKDGGAREIVIVSRRGENNYDNLVRHYDAEVLVNATPLGMAPNVDAMPADPARFPGCIGVIDVVYNPLVTRFVSRAAELGIAATAGLPMLAAQAAHAAELFSGKSIGEDAIERCAAAVDRLQRNIVLIGMPGSGKTTVGKRVAQLLGRPFLDLDADIEAAAGMPIPEYFATFGEPAFRELEAGRMAAAGLLHGAVIACGGGTPLRTENRLAMRQNGRVCHLVRDISALPKDGRPLSQKGSLEEMWEARRAFYEAAADVTVDARGGADEAARLIAKEWM